MVNSNEKILYKELYKLYIKQLLFTNNKKSWLKNLAALFVAISLLFVGISGVQAAQMSFSSTAKQAQVGEKFELNLLINTEKEDINALEGKIIFPQDLLEFKEIRDGNSIVNFWLERPRLKTNEEIFFSGITPGGYKGDSGLIFSIIFQTKKAGGGTIIFENVIALKNDGQGSFADLKTTDFQLTILEKSLIPQVFAQEAKDVDLPEPFTIEITSDPSVFNGEWFLVFATQDKASGIDHYEVKETRQRILTFFSPWIRAQSPYLLQDQELRSYLLVKAIDKAGNEKRAASLRPRNPSAWYGNYESLVIILLTIVILSVIKCLLLLTFRSKK